MDAIETARLTIRNFAPDDWGQGYAAEGCRAIVDYTFGELGAGQMATGTGLFPLLGRFLTGLPGIAALDMAILLLVPLAWGTFRQQAWAWWGSLAYWGAMTLSVVVTFASTNYLELLAIANFPPREIEFLDGIPLQGYHLALFFGLPLLATLGVIVASKQHFFKNGAK